MCLNYNLYQSFKKRNVRVEERRMGMEEWGWKEGRKKRPLNLSWL